MLQNLRLKLKRENGMAVRWKVYRDNQLFGELTGAEIRQALRDGRLDPFNQVARADSSVRMEILDVDEIFQEPKLGGDSFLAGLDHAAEEHTIVSHMPSEKSAPQSPRVAAKAAGSTPFEGPRKEIEIDDSFDSPQPQNILRTPFMAHQQGAAAQAPQEQRKIKDYYLVDKQNRRLGPLSAGEIQSLFQRGILEPKLLVQKVGDPQKITLRQFLSAFSSEQIAEVKALHSNAASKQGQQQSWNVSALVNQMHKGLATRNMVKRQNAIYYTIMVLLGVMMGLGAFFAVEIRKVKKDMNEQNRQQEVQEFNRGPNGEFSEKSQVKRTPAMSLKRSSSGSDIKSVSKASSPDSADEELPLPTLKKMLSVKSKPTVKGRSSAKTSGKSQTSNPSSSSRRSKTAAPGKPVSRPAAVRPEEDPAPLAQHRPKPPPAPVAPTPAAARVSAPVASTPAPARVSAPVAVPSAKASLAELAGKVDQVVTTTPVRYNIAALQQCPMKCILTFTYSNGESFTGLFFKGAFAEQLATKGGVASISGRVKQNGKSYQVFIQAIP